MIRADTVRNTAQTMLDRNQRRGEIGASERMRQDDPTTEGSSWLRRRVFPSFRLPH